MPQPERGTVLVTNAGRGSAIAIIRSLGRAGYRVVAADSDAASLGFRSRYASEAIVHPDPRVHPPIFCEDLLRSVRRLGVDLVVPVTEAVLAPLLERREDFERHTALAVPPRHAWEAVRNKWQTLKMARKLGVPVPETRLVETAAEALEAAPALGWPVVLKPQSSLAASCAGGMEAFEVTYANDPADLNQKMERFEGRCPVLLQRYLAGVGCGVELLMSEGRPLAAFQHRRRREVPLTGGPSSYRESVPLDPELLEYSISLLSAIGWTGLAMVEFKVGSERAELMEINGRVWGSLPLSIAAGLDFPALLARLYLEGEDALGEGLDTAYRTGVRCRDLPRDLVWISAILAQKRRYPFLPIPGRRRALQALGGLANPLRKNDLLTWDDPLPGLLELPGIVPRLLGKVRQARSLS